MITRNSYNFYLFHSITVNTKHDQLSTKFSKPDILYKFN